MYFIMIDTNLQSVYKKVKCYPFEFGIYFSLETFSNIFRSLFSTSNVVNTEYS